MSVILKHLVSSISTAKNLSKKKNSISFIKIFNIRFFYAFIFIRNFFKKESVKQNNIKTNNLFKPSSWDSFSIVNDLNEKGYNDKIKLNDIFLSQIKQEISMKNSTIAFKGEKKVEDYVYSLEKNDQLNELLKKSIKFNLSHVSLDVNIKKTNYIKNLATSDFLLDVAKNYLGKNKISISGLCYISNPANITENEKKDNAQYFHYDNDFKKFFKVFIYLSDVDINSGPHAFVQFSHNKRLFKHLLSTRLDDKEIIDNYGRENIKTFSNTKGSLIFEDTFGLHKGNLPKKNSRIVLILIYGQSEGIGIYKNSLMV